MPTYEYRCKYDNSFMELHQGFHDNTVPQCPLCGKDMNKVILATPAIFRGDGWGKSK